MPGKQTSTYSRTEWRLSGLTLVSGELELESQLYIYQLCDHKQSDQPQFPHQQNGIKGGEVREAGKIL